MKLNKIFLSMAALVFVGAMTAGCSGDDLTAETPQLPDTTNGTVVTKVTVSLDEHASTRMLNSSGMKTFEEGDKIAVIYKNTAGETMKAESAALNPFDILSSNSAKFSVTLTNPQANTPVRYIYPASMAADDVSATTPDNDATIKWSNLASQSGGFSFISEYVDLAVFDGTMTAQAVLPAATLENPLTIGAFTITNSATNDNITENVKKLIVNDGTNTYTLEGGWNTVIFVAMKPISKTQTVTIKAITADNKFIKSVTNKELAKNTKYDIDVSMTARYPFAATDTKLSSEDIGSVIGADGNIYFNAAAATAATTTARAVIAYVGNVPKYFDKFLAIAITDVGGTHTWADALTKVGEYAAAHPITIGSTPYNTNAIGATYYDKVADDVNTSSATRTTGVVKGWRLPSVTDWRYVLEGFGGSAVNSQAGVSKGGYYGYGPTLCNAINNACDNTDLSSYNYWSSSEDSSDSDKVWYYHFNLSFFVNSNKTHICYVRPVFAY